MNDITGLGAIRNLDDTILLCDDLASGRRPGTGRNGRDSNPRSLAARPLSRRVQSSTLPPFRCPG